jgi:2-polyprenyl-3-methyl-5-hydroxy-6-metoxy-1,4-benzoquinol methylase
MPLEGEIACVYRNYYTHLGPEGPQNVWQRLRRLGYRQFRESYLSYKYGYQFDENGTWRNVLARLIYITPSWRAMLDRSAMYLYPRANGRLLDVGCGSGDLLQKMQELGWRAEGVDFDAAAVENARGRGLSVNLGTLEDQNYPDNHFDSVTMGNLIEHVHKPRELLCESRRILKPGGRLVVLTPNINSLGHRIFKDSWRGLESPRHLHLFSPWSLCRLAKEAGFKTIQIQSSSGTAKWIFMTSIGIRHRAGKGTFFSNPLLLQFLAWGAELAEWGISKAIPLVGEELVMVAEK